jgi:hypothetical protein
MVKFFTEITFTGDGDPESVANETPGEYVRRYGYGTPRVDESDAGQYSRPRTGSVFDYNWGDITGNGAIRLANNLYTELGIPILLLDFGVDGSSLGTNTYFYWTDADASFRDAFEAGITAAGGDIEVLLWHNGYTDARDGTSSVYETNLGTLYSQIDGLLPAERDLKYSIAVQNRGDYTALSCDEGDCGVAYNTIRKAQIDYVDDNDFAFSAGNSIDASIALDTFGRGDGHFYASQYEIMADRFTHSILQAIGYGSEVGVRSSDVSEVAHNSTQVTVAVDHQNGDGLQVDDSGSDVEGFEISPDDWVTTWTMASGIDSATLVNNDKNIRIVLSETPTTTLKMRYLYGENVLSYKGTAAERRTKGNFVYDNYAYHTGRTGLPLNNSTADITITSDSTSPVISSVATSTISSSGATITWSTNEDSSSQLEYGPSTSYGSTNTESDINTRLTSHSNSLSGLLSCATYHYRTKSQDLAGNTTSSTDATFTTSGCTSDSEVESESAESVTTAGGGSIELLDGGQGVSLTIPAGFNENDATFQVHQLNGSTVLGSATAPSGYSGVSNFFYDFIALENATTSVSSFDEDITVTINYGDSDVSNLDESSLSLFRWNGSSWSALSSCVVDVDANSITCTTAQFSTYAVFGEPVAASSSGGSYIHFNLSINNNDNYTSSKTVVLNFSSNVGIDRLLISNNNDFFEAVEVDYVDTKPWELSSGEGGKRVYVKFYANSGYVSEIISDAIVLEYGDINLSEHRLIKYANSPKVYLLENNKKRWIVNEETFNVMGYRWSDLEIILDSETYENGQDILTNQEVVEQEGEAESENRNTYQFTHYLYLGSVGQEVRDLQVVLKNLGYFNHPSITGYYGPITTEAVKKFQLAHGIEQVGVVGPKTRAKLNQ